MGGTHAFAEKPGGSQHLSKRGQETKRWRRERDGGQATGSASNGTLPTPVRCALASGFGSFKDGSKGLWNLAVVPWLNGDSAGSVPTIGHISAFKPGSALTVGFLLFLFLF